MSNFKPNYFQRRSKPQGPKSNQQIRAIDVQVIGSDGNNLGTLPLNKAIEKAKAEGLDHMVITGNDSHVTSTVLRKSTIKRRSDIGPQDKSTQKVSGGKYRVSGRIESKRLADELDKK